jgi:GR25 family glycosyltransferase involved in LPS biosynthesis
MADVSALPPIRYVNLDRDGARRAAMEAEFARLGLHAERFPAVLWSALAPEAQARYYSEALNRRQHHLPLVGGEKGCYASHLQLWRWLLDSPHACAVVLEDDVALEPDFAALCTAIAQLGEPWHMVKLIGREGLGREEKLLGSQALAAGTSWCATAASPASRPATCCTARARAACCRRACPLAARSTSTCATGGNAAPISGCWACARPPSAWPTPAPRAASTPR